MERQLYLITIDGPAASGKSSVSRAVAKELGWNWLSTGAFYRGLAFVARREEIDPDDVHKLVELSQSPIWRVEMSSEETKVFYRQEDVTRLIQDETVGNYASRISPHPEVRASLLEAQRACAEEGAGLVAEGRDCGTVVFPQAALKIFLTAREKDRALRRAQEQGKDVEAILRAQEQRDLQDSSRATAPLQVASNGIVIDTSEMGFEKVVSEVLLNAFHVFPELRPNS